MRGESQRSERETPGYRYTEPAEYPGRGRHGHRHGEREGSAYREPAGYRYAGPDEYEADE